MGLEAINPIVETWASNLRSQLNSGIPSSGKFGVKTKERDGVVEKVGVRFQRWLVFREKGASRGHGGAKGSKWINAKGEKRQTNPKSFGKMDAGARKAQPHFNPIIKDQLPKLSDLLKKAVGQGISGDVKRWLIK